MKGYTHAVYTRDWFLLLGLLLVGVVGGIGDVRSALNSEACSPPAAAAPDHALAAESS